MFQSLSEAEKVNFREIIPPEKFQEYFNDNSVQIDFEAVETPDFIKNLDTFISNIKEQKKTIPKEFLLISLCVDPKYFYIIPIRLNIKINFFKLIRKKNK